MGVATCSPALHTQAWSQCMRAESAGSHATCGLGTCLGIDAVVPVEIDLFVSDTEEVKEMDPPILTAECLLCPGVQKELERVLDS